MEGIAVALAVLACPVLMGGMMWFMAKGMRNDRPAEQPERAASVERLREEHRRLGAELERIEGRDEPVARRS
ncbi:MAG TPA: hypothetical protein VGR11_08620 [Solirubrobacteraceae bacterium]|nr:hypothetical protein [Solirubrobacteraceae bacterium]